jgi:hypothetical protein
MGRCRALLPESRRRRAWRRHQATFAGSRFRGLVQQISAGRVPMPGLSWQQRRADCARVPPAAQCRAVGGEQAAPDSVLADIPMPQRQFQALGAYQAGGADRDSRRSLVAGLVCLRTDREPLVGIEGAVSAAGVPDDPVPQGPIGELDGRRRIRRPGRSPVQSVRGRPGIRRCGGSRPDRAYLPVTRCAGRGLTRGAACPALARPERSAGPPRRLRPAALR